MAKLTNVDDSARGIHELIANNTDKLLADLNSENETVGIFTIKGANKCLRDSSCNPPPQNLYHGLIHEGEVSILFADTGQGKSIFATQIADSIARDGYISLLADFELSEKQFENRNSVNYTNHYSFSENFYRAEINTDEADYIGHGFTSIDEYIVDSLIQAIKQTGATFLVIDNLTYIGKETEKSKDALPLMKRLKEIKKNLGVTILCLAHTPKRDLSKPITVNDLAGSKMLINFCDSAFAIGQSTQDKSLRYVKQVKARATEIMYDSENVALYRIVKPDNFLHFEFIGHSTEREHLKVLTEQDKQNIRDKILELHADGKTLRQIGETVCRDHMFVKRTIEKANKV